MPNMEPKKNPMPVQDAYARICNFDEVALGYIHTRRQWRKRSGA